MQATESTTVARTGVQTPDHSIESVALVSPGGRVHNITQPLQTTSVDYTLNPSHPGDADVIFCDTPDRNLFKIVASKPLHRTPVVFRMRGNPYRGIDEWHDSRTKRLAMERSLQHVDGCVAITPDQARIYREQTGVPTRIASLPINASEWPTTTHTDRELRILSLTNAVYKPKIQPLIDAIPTVDAVLDIAGGEWRIGSWSTGYDDQLRAAVDGHDNVSFDIGLDAHAELQRANLMIHFSNMDVLPNAILEGMASRLPVLANDYDAFTHSDAPVRICEQPSDVTAALQTFRDPVERETAGEAGLKYVCERHAPERIGREFVDALAAFTRGGGDA